MLKQRVFKKVLDFITSTNDVKIADVAGVGNFEAGSNVSLAISRVQEDPVTAWVKVQNIFVSRSLMKPADQEAAQPLDARLGDEVVSVVVPNADNSNVAQVTCSFEEYMFGTLVNGSTTKYCTIPPRLLKHYAHKLVQMETIQTLKEKLAWAVVGGGDAAAAQPPEAPYTVDNLLTDSKVATDNDDAIVQSGTVSLNSVMKYLLASAPGTVYHTLVTAMPTVVQVLRKFSPSKQYTPAAGSSAYTSMVRACMYAIGALRAKQGESDVIDFGNGIWASSVTRVVFVRNGEMFIDCPIYWLERMLAMQLRITFDGTAAPPSPASLPAEQTRMVEDIMTSVVGGGIHWRSLCSFYILHEALPNLTKDMSLHNFLCMLRELYKGEQLPNKTETLGALWKPNERGPFTPAPLGQQQSFEAADTPALTDAEVKANVFATAVPGSDCFERCFGSPSPNMRVYSVSKPSVNLWYGNFTHAYVVHT